MNLPGVRFRGLFGSQLTSSRQRAQAHCVGVDGHWSVCLAFAVLFILLFSGLPIFRTWDTSHKKSDSRLLWTIKTWQHCGHLPTWPEFARATGNGEKGRFSPYSARPVHSINLHPHLTGATSDFEMSYARALVRVSWVLFPSRPAGRFSIIRSRGGELRLPWPPQVSLPWGPP